MGEMAPLRIRRATLLAGRHPYNAFGVKIRQGLEDSANGDENWRPGVFSSGAQIFLSRRNFHPPAPKASLRLRRRGASFHWGGLPAPAAPLGSAPGSALLIKSESVSLLAVLSFSLIINKTLRRLSYRENGNLISSACDSLVDYTALTNSRK